METARALAKMGAKVVIVGRSQSKTESVVAELKQSTDAEHIDYILADLSLMAQVRKVAETFKSRYDRLDVLVNNAGAVFFKKEITSEGIEMTFALNHLNYFLLTNLLLDVLIDSAPARVVNVSSEAHRVGINFDNLQGEKRFQGFQIYGQSKFMNILFTKELARRLEGKGVTANALHPGFVGSGFAHNNRGVVSMALRLVRPFILTPEKGAKSSIYLASSPEVANVTGKYFNEKAQMVNPIPAAENREYQRRLWEISEQITGITTPVAAV
jgi:NAD(P)-dependent dehydrogenase (short-subunit alcohol dehydrogenase family)